MDPRVSVQNMSLLFERTPTQKKQLARDLVAIQDPTSPTYHQWLTPAEFGARYGAAPQDVARARAWLETQGFQVLQASPTSDRLSFNGTVGQIESAFRTEMHRYQVRGEGHFALSRAPAVPAELGTLVAALHGAHDIRIPPHRTPVHPLASYSGSYALGPSDFATIYDVAPLYAANITGKGQSIAIVGESFMNLDDVVSFRQTFGLDTTNVPTPTLVPNTGASQVLDPGDVSESELDLEWSGGIAQDANIFFVYTGDSPTNYGFFDSIVYAVENRVAPIVSVSYGTCEQGLTPSDAVFYAQVGDLASMIGVTVLVASGDTGAAGCDGEQESAATQGLFVGFPASIPTITAVGGTQFNFTTAAQSTYWTLQSAAKTYIPEIAWNETFSAHAQGLGASGGGYSVMFARPYWQAGALPSSSFRGVPDVALSASADDTPYLIYESWTNADGPGQAPFPGTLMAIGGTSASTPSFAGIVALLNQALKSPTPGVGNIGPVLYALNTSAPTAFHDITGGNNIVPCASGTTNCPVSPSEYGYSAGMGYDLATGLGSVDAFNLVTAWTTLVPTSTALAITGSGGVEGTNITLTATIGSSASTTIGSAGGGHLIGGKVTFYFQTVTADGTPDIGYTLGDAVVAADTADGGLEGATATLTTPAPVGLTGAAKIVAFYGGDKDYMASYSAASSVMSTTSFAVTPTSITLQPNQQTTFSTSGGVPPVSWHLTSDSTCDNNFQHCSEIKVTGPTTVGFQAGRSDGTVTLTALDSDFAEVQVTITIAGSAIDGGMLFPIDAGTTHDAGHVVDAGEDSGQGDDAASDHDGSADATHAHDAGKDTGSASDASTSDDTGAKTTTVDAAKKSDASDTPGSSGGCAIATPQEGPDFSLVGAMVLGLVPVAARRRRGARGK